LDFDLGCFDIPVQSDKLGRCLTAFNMQPFTSDSHPLRVDFLPLHRVGLVGRIGMTIAPGKQHQGMYALWQRDLEQDLTRLRNHYKTDRLVSLIEAHELEQLRIPNLFDQVKACNIHSEWFPIQDFSTPTSMTGLIKLVESILSAVQAGKTVVIHCKGGLGRSGLVAAACLVALKYAPEDAFAIVRQARPGSVETAEQEAYVYKFAHAWKAA
jgi:protein-tyrosine phosphatase